MRVYLVSQDDLPPAPLVAVDLVEVLLFLSRLSRLRGNLETVVVPHALVGELAQINRRQRHWYWRGGGA